MTLFVDASAAIAILGGEPERETMLARLLDEDAIWSPVARWETIVGLHKSYRLTLPEATQRTFAFAEDLRIRMVAIGEQEADLALRSYAVYGKGVHPAALNMGDCFAYACATANNARLLYKGNDFVQTDLA